MNGGPFTAPQLKIIAEICSLTTFAIFSSIVLKEKLLWVDLGAFSFTHFSWSIAISTNETCYFCSTLATSS
jgi:uncharacterized protein (DUF486 family)